LGNKKKSIIAGSDETSEASLWAFTIAGCDEDFEAPQGQSREVISFTEKSRVLLCLGVVSLVRFMSRIFLDPPGSSVKAVGLSQNVLLNQ
jgi:hypothetical protein